jgi:L-fuconolactonase
MPDFPIVDAHVHLYDPHRFRMPWLDGNALLDKPYGPAEYREHTQGVDVGALVFAQVEVAPAYGLLEAEWVAKEVSRQEPRIQAIMGWAPVEHGDHARSYLEALVKIDPRVTAVRQITQFDPDPEMCLRPGFLRGVQILPEFGLAFDICCYHPQMGPTIEMIRRTPGTQFVLDHIGKPDIKNHLRDPWWQQIKEMAALPNVSCKVSGVITEADHKAWTLDDIRPYVERVLEVFPEDRVMYGGDWTVVLMAGSYRQWFESVERLTESLSPAAKRKFWADNARRFYRLPASA